MIRPSPPRSRIARTLRAARRVVCVLALAFAGSSIAWAAPPHAFFTQVQFRGHEGFRGNGARAAMREQRMQQAGGQRGQRAAQREQAQQQRAQEIREAPPPVPRPVEVPPAEGRPGRLTPEERRALRQQINDAGREIYRPRRP